MSNDLVKVRVYKLPDCNLCGLPARYDARTYTGQWAYLCAECFVEHTPGKLGLGIGQELITESKPNV